MNTICSTKILPKNGDKFIQRDDLFPEGLVTEMYVVSAYTDIDVIKWLVGELQKAECGSSRSRIILKIFLDERYSRFDDDNMRAFLLKINNTIKSATTQYGRLLFDDESGIYLVRRGALFHSKLIVTRTTQATRVIIGSLNFTKNAFKSNEELVYVCDDAILFNKARKYISLLESFFDKSETPELKGSIRISKVSPNLNFKSYKNETLDEYLLDGFLVHPARKRAFPEYFKLNLPKDIIESSLEELEHKDLIEGKGLKGSISVLKMLQIIDKSLIDLKKAQKEGKGKWTSLCVDTPLGLWCPKDKIDELKSKVSGVEDLKNYHTFIFNKLDEKREKLGELFKAVILEISAVIKNVQEKNGKEINWDYFDEEVALKAWNNWFSDLLGRKEDATWFDRLNCIVSITKMPAIFDDPVSGRAFKKAFIESLRSEIDIPYGFNIADEIYKNNKDLFDKECKSLGLKKLNGEG
jgi:hypothetical protein